MAGYISKYATGAAIEAILDKANNSQSVSAAEKSTWNNKQNALTFDTTPTENSTNPVTSGGVQAELALLLEAVAALALSGAKNLLKCTATAQNINGVDFTVSTDGVISAGGTSSSESNRFIIGTFTPERSGDYLISSDTVSSGTGKHRCQLRAGASSSSTLVTNIFNDPVMVTLTAGIEYTMRVYFPEGITFTDTFYPMIRDAAINDGTYAPFACDNVTLTRIVQDLTARVEALETN